MGPSLAGEGWGAGARAHKAFSGHIRLRHAGERDGPRGEAHSFPTRRPPDLEVEAAQTLRGAMASTGLREKPQAFLT